ncbi:hypothetical protein [Rhodococcus sp. NPDC004095]
MPKKGITEKQFNEVIRRDKADEPDDVISARVGVKPSTIKAIRQAKTYAEYERRRKLRTRRVSAERALHPAPAPVKAVAPKQAIAAPALMKPLGRPPRAAGQVPPEVKRDLDVISKHSIKTGNRLDTHIKNYVGVWDQFYDQEFAPLCKDFREVKEAVAQIQRRDAAEAAKRRKFNKTFIGRIVKRFSR